MSLYKRTESYVRWTRRGAGRRPTHTPPPTHTAASRRVRTKRASAPTDRLARRILIIMKGETLFVGQELNL